MELERERALHTQEGQGRTERSLAAADMALASPGTGTAPLAELGSMMLYATRRTAVLPNVAMVRRFPGSVSRAELDAERHRLASNPYGLGRCLIMPVVPGARPLWRANTEPSPLSLGPEAVDSAALANWFADEMSVRENPLNRAGWHVAAVETEGSTFVAVVINHLYGTGRDIVMNVWGDGGHASANEGAPEDSGPLATVTRHDVRAEVNDLMRRLGTGARGIARLGAQALPGPHRRDGRGEGSPLLKPIEAVLDRDPSRGRPSTRRVMTVAAVDRDEWAEAAARHGGNALSLQVAVNVNLLRDARRARGGDTYRALRIIIPVDLTGHAAEADLGGVPDLTSADVVISGGLPVHGDLSEVRDTCRAAIAEARAEVAATGRVPVAPGMVDALRLLPDALTTRLDGAVSSLGRLPSGLGYLGDHEASDVFPIAFPLGSDISMTTGEFGDQLTLGLVADPSRLGAGPSLRERFAAELERWGIEGAQIW